MLAAVLLYLAPKGSGRMLKLAVRLFFLLSLMIPFGGWEGEAFTLPETEEELLSDDLEAAVQLQLEQAVAETLREQAVSILRDAGAENARVRIGIHNHPESGISITELTVQTDPVEQQAVIRAVPKLTETFGITVNLEEMEEEDAGDTEKTDG